MLTAGCGHFICKGCWKGYLSAYIDDKQRVMRLKCPAITDDGKPCCATVPRSLLAQVAEPDMLEKLADYDDALLVETNSRASWCAATAGCTAVAVVNGPPPQYPMCAPQCSPVHFCHARAFQEYRDTAAVNVNCLTEISHCTIHVHRPIACQISGQVLLNLCGCMCMDLVVKI